MTPRTGMLPMQSWMDSNILLSFTHMHPFQNYKIKYIYPGEVVGEAKEGGTGRLLILPIPVSRLAFVDSQSQQKDKQTILWKNPKVSLISLKNFEITAIWFHKW